jgi:AraC family transcriptional regulator of adaptative response / DNA-3-methyladenine glycosylase II
VSNLPITNTEVCRELSWLHATNRNLKTDVETATGKTLNQIIRDNRLDFARKLVSETNISLKKIAEGTGFGTIHHLDDALKNRFDRVSASLRRKKTDKKNGVVELVLYYRPPFDWLACLDYYAKQKIGNLERIENEVYKRDFIFDGRIEHVKIKNQQEKNRLIVQISSRDVSCIYFVLSNVRRMFDVGLIPSEVADFFERSFSWINRDKLLGVRLISCWNPFEAAVTAILSQLVSVDRAKKLTIELMELAGKYQTSAYTGEKILLFPTPDELMKLDLSCLKVPRIRKDAITGLAQQVHLGHIVFTNFQNLSDFRKKIMSIRGIGSWTAEYVALRALGDVDSFPSGDAMLDKLSACEPDTLKPLRGYLASYLYKYGVNKIGENGEVC